MQIQSFLKPQGFSPLNLQCFPSNSGPNATGNLVSGSQATNVFNNLIGAGNPQSSGATQTFPANGLGPGLPQNLAQGVHQIAQLISFVLTTIGELCQRLGQAIFNVQGQTPGNVCFTGGIDPSILSSPQIFSPSTVETSIPDTSIATSQKEAESSSWSDKIFDLAGNVLPALIPLLL